MEGIVVVLGFLSACLVLCLLMIARPSVFTKANIASYRFTFKLLGYHLELKPIVPNRPEQIVKMWGIVCTALLVLLLGLALMTLK